MRDVTTITRRRSIALGTTVLLGGGALAYSGAEPAASLQVAGLDVSPTDRQLGPDSQVSGVRLDLSIDYEWSASHQPTSAELTAFVSPSASGSFAELDALTFSDPVMNDSGTADLSGDLVDTDAFEAADFDVAEGATTTQDVAVKVVLSLFRDGTRIGLADVSDSATVTLSRDELTVSASIAGTGTLSVNAG